MVLFTTDNGNMVKEKLKEPKFGKMVLTMKAIGQITKLTEKVV